eukprot:758417-Hanusia_phi.AAC.2
MEQSSQESRLSCYLNKSSRFLSTRYQRTDPAVFIAPPRSKHSNELIMYIRRAATCSLAQTNFRYQYFDNTFSLASDCDSACRSQGTDSQPYRHQPDNEKY